MLRNQPRGTRFTRAYMCTYDDVRVDTRRKDRRTSHVTRHTSHASESPTRRCPSGSGVCIETSRNARPIGLRSFDKRARCPRIIITIPGRGEPVVPLYVPLLYIPTTVLRYQSLETLSFESYVFLFTKFKALSINN